MKIKIISLALVAILMVGGLVGGSFAWLSDETDPVKNVFTAGDIEITLAETEGTENAQGDREFKMIPGETIAKDPLVTVLANSEACWLFVEIEESADLDNYITYGVATGWTALPDVDGVYYREVASDAADQEFQVLAGDIVTVINTVDADDLAAVNEGEAEVDLTFTAYAIQKSGMADAATAWAALNPPVTP